MKHYNCPGDLKAYGFDCLTGEACGLGMRLLFDITAPAKAVLVKALGVCDITLLQDWNGGKAVGSVLLDRSFCSTLAVFSMLEAGCLEVWQNFKSGDICGLEDAEEVAMCANYDRNEWRIWRYAGTAGSRNMHVMSGRVS